MATITPTKNTETLLSPFGLDYEDWQGVSIWCLAIYGFLQFVALNLKESSTVRRKNDKIRDENMLS